VDDLPAVVQQGGTFLSNPMALQDAAYRKMIIDWGYEQIAAEYPLDPVRAPLNALRRKRAEVAWQRVIRTNGKELRNVVAGQAVEQLRFELERYRNDIVAADRERQRQAAVVFDKTHRMDEHESMADLLHQQQLRLMERQHELEQQAADAELKRRKEERAHEVEQEITLKLNEALIRSAGTTSAQEVVDAVRTVNQEISRIRRDPDLTDDERHLHIKSLLDQLPSMLRTPRAHDI
jgi:hypothetical protein